MGNNQAFMILLCSCFMASHSYHRPECQQVTPRKECPPNSQFGCLCGVSSCPENETELVISNCDRQPESLLPLLHAQQDADALEIDGSKITLIPQFVCNNMTSLGYLKLTNNSISSIPSDCFQKLSALKQVYLRNNRIQNLSHVMFNDSINLEVLDVSNNNISSISIEAWLSIINLSSLKTLKLNGNKINEEVLSPLKRVSLHMDLKLHLYNNPFKCNCDTVWIKTWIMENENNLANISKMECVNPVTKATKPILEAADDSGFFLCSSKKIEQEANNVIQLAVVFVLILTILPLSVVLFCALVYRHRRVVYSKTSWHPFDREECEGESVTYDVYISCSLDNEEWVQNVLMKFLDAHNYKVTWHREHLNSGHSSMYDNIGACIENSKRTLCLLSKKYSSNDLCMFELNYTLNMDAKLKRRRTMIMICEDFNAIQLEEELQKHITKYPSLNRKSPNLNNEMMYLLPLAKLGEPAEKDSDGQVNVIDIPQNVPMYDYF